MKPDTDARDDVIDGSDDAPDRRVDARSVRTDAIDRGNDAPDRRVDARSVRTDANDRGNDAPGAGERPVGGDRQ